MPNDQSFVHLHVHTEFSLLDGLSKINKLVNRAKDLNMPALAITDHGTMFGVIDFYRACKKAGIKPVIGVEAYVARRGMQDRDSKLDTRPFHMLLLAKNMEGYKNLLKISSAAQLEGYYYRPRVDFEFLAAHSEGLIATSGCLAAQIPSMIMNGEEKEARDRIDWYLQTFGKDNFFLELQQHDIPELRTVNNWLIETGKRDDVRFLATNDVHYVLNSDYDPHDTLLCIQTGSIKTDTKRLRMTDNSYYLADTAEMWQAFGHINDGEPLKNSLLISEMTDLSLEREGYHLPIFPVPSGYDSVSYLRMLCEKGMYWRYGDNPDATVRERLDFELNVINTMGFDTYFLIVWDLCEFARHADIWWNVRGSGAGSVAAYCLGITNIDPLQNNLLFERFLNPGRVSMPDIDIDYPEDRRSEMIAYTVQKYGEDKVAAIITFGTLGAKAAVRDVGRALNVDLNIVSSAAKLIPTEPKPKPVKVYVDENPELKRMYDNVPEIRQVIDTAAELQGISRHASTHAAGIIVGDKPLVEYIPLHRQTKGDDPNNPLKQVTQFPMETCESIGLLKVDFLGLSTLTILRRACDLIERHRGIRYTMDNIPYRPNDDEQQNRMLEEAFDMMGRGETIGVFQVESSGMQQMLRGMRPKKFEHIVAGIALYRPGPMDYIPTYNARMHGKEPVIYHHPELEPIIGETYGILVYQEQIMQVAGKLFGYSLGEADLMRRAVSKKKKEDLLKHRQIFIDNGPAHGVDEETAIKIFDEIEFFANYGFNKSHAADYGVITVQTAFLKCHYPEEYMAALLSVYYDDAVKVTTFLGECKRLGIAILPPDINYSQLDFDIQEHEGKRAIRFGLAAIKNAGKASLQQIIDERNKDGIFTDLEDLCQRLDLRAIGKRTIESLIKVGAISGMGTRPQLLAALERMITYSGNHHKAKGVGQMDIFGDMLEERSASSDLLNYLPDYEEASTRDMLNWERELLGLYITSHPIDPIHDKLQHIQPHYTHELKDAENNNYNHEMPVKLVALVAGIRKMPTKRHDIMGIVTLEDRYGTIDAVLFPRTWTKYEDIMEEGQVIFLSGTLDLSRGEPQVIAEHATQSFDAVVAEIDPVIADAPATEWQADVSENFGNVGNGNGNAHGNGNGNGNSYAQNGNTNGNAAPAPAATAEPDFPAWSDELPAWLDDDEPYIGLPPMQQEEAQEEKARNLIIKFERTDNVKKDERRLERLYHTLISYPGKDRFVIVLNSADGLYEMKFPNETTNYNDARLIEKLENIVGKGAVSVES